MTAPNTGGPDGHPLSRGLLDVPGVAQRLGVTVRHIRRLVAERRIPYCKIGGLLRFDPDDIDRWLDERRVQPRP